MKLRTDHFAASVPKNNNKCYHKKMIKTNANLKNLINYSAGGILSKELVKSETANVTLFCMAKTTAISKHTAGKEAIVYVTEGKGEFTLEKKTIKMLAGTMIQMKKGQLHKLSVSENTSFLLFLFG